VTQLLSVILLNGEIDRFHPFEIFGINLMQEPRFLSGSPAEEIGELVQQRAYEIDGIKPVMFNLVAQVFSEVRIYERIDD
jgi:hypothetical protein